MTVDCRSCVAVSQCWVTMSSPKFPTSVTSNRNRSAADSLSVWLSVCLLICLSVCVLQQLMLSLYVCLSVDLLVCLCAMIATSSCWVLSETCEWCNFYGWLTFVSVSSLAFTSCLSWGSQETDLTVSCCRWSVCPTSHLFTECLCLWKIRKWSSSWRVD